MSLSPASILYNADGVAVTVDPTHLALATIDLPHYKVHAGLHHVCHSWSNVGGAESVLDVLLRVPAAKFPHLKWSFTTGDAFTFTFYEGTIVSANGTALTVVNNNRNSTNVAGVTTFLSPTVTTAGTALMSGQLSIGARSGGSDSRDSEFILKPSTNYLLRFIKSNAGTAFVEHEFSWYENA